MTKLLKKVMPLEWTAECEASFKEIKEPLTSTLILTLPKEESPMSYLRMLRKNGMEEYRCKMTK